MSQISNRDFLKALATALLALVISAAVLIPAYLALFTTLHPEFADSQERSAKPATINGAQFRPVVFGDGGIEGSSAVISQLAEGKPADQAVLLHQRRFSAADYPFLRHHIEGWHPGLRVMLFWRRADDPQTNHYSELDYTGEGAGYFNLLRSEEWRGQIVELAVGFFGELRGSR
ncbi:hypothetical protein [Kineobactrum salinum]|uniref:Uncharacterized protein n=1 Tax=Kineobactrum salinum TaxID=2708301 RepID=A0A6C0U1J5_9GAMM|nr:hypothetical protein [Kineobactrum salinum]QIB65980.1 hypothetical protein G3T16_11670 [Kineobactrum salinum]